MKPQTGKLYFHWDDPYEITKQLPPKKFVTSHEFVVNADRLKRAATIRNRSHQQNSVIEQRETIRHTPPTNPSFQAIESDTINANTLENNPNNTEPSIAANTKAPQLSPDHTSLVTKRPRGRPRKTQSTPTFVSADASEAPVLPTRQLRSRINLPAKLSHPDIL